MKKTPTIAKTAKEKLDLKKLRPGQKEAVQSLLDGRDTLVLMPTGAGKSAIYQIAALLIPGPTVVVSPLIALQQDQVQSINANEHNDAAAAVLNSSLRPAQRAQVMDGLDEGELEFIFLAPEQFNNPETLEHLQKAKPSLFVVDEAHCMAAWGHDFRPDYLKLGGILESLGHPVTLALTATAAPPVREEITQRLNMREPNVIVQGFDRPNIHLSLESFERCENKSTVLLERVFAMVNSGEKPGIVYTATRKEAEEVATRLAEGGVKAVCYHAGLKADEREQVQNRFMTGGADVIVATVAFGMGVDKADVRFVFHLDVSDSIDSYYQEVGRAGRDGQPAQAVLFYCQQDLGLRRFQASNGPISNNDVFRVIKALLKHRSEGNEPVALPSLQEDTELSKTKLRSILGGLEEAKLLKIRPDGRVCVGKVERGLTGKLAGKIVEAQHARNRFEKTRLDMMEGYAETRDCLRKYLLNYFGEEFEPTGQGGCCSHCDAGTVREETDAAARPFSLNARVAHAKLGNGQVMRYEGDKMVVLFDENGYKTLGIELVIENKLLVAAS